MTLFMTTPPAAEPVTLAQAKAHLRLDQPDEDALVERLIAAAREHVESVTRRRLVAQGWRLALDEWPRGGVVHVPLTPLRAVTAVTVYDRDGVPATVPPTDYAVDLGQGRVAVAAAARPGRVFNGLEIDVEAGYGAPVDVPAALAQAVLSLVAHWFEHREAVSLEVAPAVIPHGFDALVAPLRVMSL